MIVIAKSTPMIEAKIAELRGKGAFIHVMRAPGDSSLITQCDVFQVSWTSKLTLEEAHAQLWEALMHKEYTDTAKFAVTIRQNGKIVESWIETVAWEELDNFEIALIEKYPGFKVEVIEDEN